MEMREWFRLTFEHLCAHTERERWGGGVVWSLTLLVGIIKTERLSNDVTVFIIGIKTCFFIMSYISYWNLIVDQNLDCTYNMYLVTAFQIVKYDLRSCCGIQRSGTLSGFTQEDAQIEFETWWHHCPWPPWPYGYQIDKSSLKGNE